MRSRTAVMLGALWVAGCADVDDDRTGASLVASTVDLAEYLLPSCGAASRAWRVDAQEFRTIPLGEQRGMAHYVFVKSWDGDGYEDWWIDRDWLRIRLDRTWAYCITSAGTLCAPGDGLTHLWCDVQCSTENTAARCQQRWNRDPASPTNGLRPRARWAATEYRDPADPTLPAPFVRRRLTLPFDRTARFDADMRIAAVDRDTCAACATNFDTAPTVIVRRSVEAARVRAWRGFGDVVSLRVTSGPGQGEVSYYARGLGLVGFGIGSNISVASALLDRSTTPQGACIVGAPASACGVGGNACRYFPETGQHLCGRFRQYWEQHGGLAVFGFPVGAAEPALGEDGRAYPAQWFERARFELHGELDAPYDVLLARLGDARFRATHGGADFWSTPRDSGPRTRCQWFAETQLNVCDDAPGVGATGFLTFWRGHGLEFDGRAGFSYAESLALLGLPLTAVREETLADGRRYQVQWFERARMELHPENPPQYRVLLGLLGNESLGRP